MSNENRHPNTEAESSEFSNKGEKYIKHTERVSEDSIYASASKNHKKGLNNFNNSHRFLRTQIDTDSDNVVLESQRDYRNVTDVDTRDCGEPLKPQVLRIDFDPLDGVDDDFVQKKCVEFWKFIDGNPDLKSLKVIAKKESVTKDSFTEMTPPESVSSTSSESSEGLGFSPITMMTLNWLKHGDLMTHALATKAVIRPCDLVSKYEDYNKNKADGWSSRRKQKVTKEHRVPTSVSRSISKSHAPSSSKVDQENSLTRMVAEMKRWDSQHPKSMAPPNNPAGLSLEKPESILLPYITDNEDKYCEKCIN
uniref:Uncharacterized protein n=1 Tax=Heliothis virescens TaxID=7102 RepID=A0A2A4J4R2_HELVI